MPNYGIVTKIYKKERRTIDIGEMLDVESGNAYPFEAPANSFGLRERVRWEPSSYVDDKIKEVVLFKTD